MATMNGTILSDLKVGDLFKTTVDESHLPEAKRTKRLLNFERYRSYFIALRDNDVEKVSSMLSEADELEKDALLNGRFDFWTGFFYSGCGDVSSVATVVHSNSLRFHGNRRVAVEGRF